MLAPGDYLIKPPEESPANPSAVPPAQGAGEPAQPDPTAEVEEAKPPSFLLILLRALGAIHS